ncbi:tyrosine-type recombinase/integrase [Brachyspira aalborgi]|jgi:site-specific recombinase XerD|uniref:Site-specific integrase n=2 Tax=Brachyspira aalborgi TaxID=29522 RepID=A0ABY3K6M6_9SPIR|nr:site-specific integrase [Brachyspira aalborgi]TXJ31133.1 site-specific integrase [Brachyspira aalborgi]DAZ18851.1 MAG TPA: Integrase [Caudoviricetes sp.]
MISILNFNYLLSDNDNINNSLLFDFHLPEKDFKSGDLFMLKEKEYINYYAISNKMRSLKMDVFWLKNFFGIDFIKSKQIKDISKSDVKRAFGELLKKYKRGSSALNSCASALRKYYNFLNDTTTKYKLDLSVFNIKLPKRIHKSPSAFLFRDVINLFKENYHKTKKFIERRDLIAFLLYSTTGARKNELTNLKIKNVSSAYGNNNSVFDFEEHKIKIFQSKTEEYRIVLLPPIAMKYINLYLEEREKYANRSADSFFINANGENASESIMDRIPERFQKKYGIKFHLHQLRAGYVSDLYDSGIDLTMVSRIIGHKSVDTTNKHYLDLQNKQMIRAVKRHPSFSVRKQKLEEKKPISNEISDEVLSEYIKNNMHKIIDIIKKASADAGNNSRGYED